jgi:hypothetical protein
MLPGELKKFPDFQRDFCLTDIVADIDSFPEGLASKAS